MTVAKEKRRTSRKKQKTLARRRFVTAGVVFTLAATVAAVFFVTQQRFDPQARIAQATREMEAGDYPAGIIILKNVINHDKTNRDARFLLG